MNKMHPLFQKLSEFNDLLNIDDQLIGMRDKIETVFYKSFASALKRQIRNQGEFICGLGMIDEDAFNGHVYEIATLLKINSSGYAPAITSVEERNTVVDFAEIMAPRCVGMAKEILFHELYIDWPIFYPVLKNVVANTTIKLPEC